MKRLVGEIVQLRQWLFLREISSAYLCFTSTCLLCFCCWGMSPNTCFPIVIIIIIISQHRPSSNLQTFSIEVTISRTTSYVTTAAFHSLLTSPRTSQRRRHIKRRETEKKKHCSPFRNRNTCNKNARNTKANKLHRSCDTTDADAVYQLYQFSTYARIACILRIIPHPKITAPTSGMDQCNLVWAE